jgi:hypothetical protein
MAHHSDGLSPMTHYNIKIMRLRLILDGLVLWHLKKYSYSFKGVWEEGRRDSIKIGGVS